MSTIDAYGEFEMPEEKAEIEVMEDPVKTVHSCYEFFTNTLFKEIKKNHFPPSDYIYQTALKPLEGKEKLKFTVKETEYLTKQLSADRYANIFLSAVHNQTSLKTLIINHPHFIEIGYRLKPNKTLVLTPNIMIYCAGRFGKGTIINYGEIECLGFIENENNIVLNYGKIKNDPIKSRTILDIKEMKTNYFPEEHKINNVIKIYFNERWCVDLNKSNISKIPSREKLNTKLKEISFLDKLPELTYEKQYEKVDAFDFKKFQKELEEIVEEIYESKGAGK